MAHSHSRRRHGTELRGLEFVPRSSFHEKQRFGRLFPDLPPLEADQEPLKKLAASMKETSERRSGDSRTIPAGFTFLGQFIDHDITLDTTSSLEQQNDPAAIRNFRTPLLELDSVYGRGPDVDPFLYDSDKNRPGRFLMGSEKNPHDLPRNKQETALIGDPRNDENTIISQLHMTMLKFHNAVVDLVEKDEGCGIRYFPNDSFREAQRLVRWHYQWIVVHEFLPSIVDGKLLKAVFEGDDHKCYRMGLEPFMPVEFAVAAYRFGHSQVRSSYDVNAGRKDVELFGQPPNGLTFFGAVPAESVIDWRYFFEIGGSKPQPSRKIDTRLAAELFDLPFTGDPDRDRNSLAFRNLLRGLRFGLPSGEAVAQFLGVDVLSPKQTGVDKFGLKQTPLWYYILKEAERNKKDDKLGEVGGRILAETFHGMLKGDNQSYVYIAPGWRPTLTRNGKFGIADLISIAGGADSQHRTAGAGR